MTCNHLPERVRGPKMTQYRCVKCGEDCAPVGELFRVPNNSSRSGYFLAVAILVLGSAAIVRWLF